MPRRTEVEVLLRGRDELSPAVKRAEGALGKLAGFLTSRLVLGVGAAALSLRQLTRALAENIRAAGVQEQAIAKLEAALAPLGDRAGEVAKRLREHSSALQEVTTFGDEVILQGQALIASFVRDEEAIKRATEAALDMATALGIDVRTAFLLLGRAAAGNTELLSRYGITLDQNIPKSERFAAAIAKINEQFGGAARAQAETYAGQLQQIGNLWGDLREKAGPLTLALLDQAGVLEGLKGILAELNDLIGRYVDVEGFRQRLEQERAQLLERRVQLEAEVARLEAGRLGVMERARDEAARALGQETKLEAKRRELAEVNAQLSEVEQKLAIARKANAQATGEATDATERYLEAARALGIVLEAEVTQRLGDVHERLELLRQAYEAGAITLSEYQAAQEAATAEQERIRQAFEASGGSLERFNELLSATREAATGVAPAFAQLGESVSGLSDHYERAAASAQRFVEVVRVQREELERTNAVTSKSPFGTTFRSREFQLPLEASRVIQARQTLRLSQLGGIGVRVSGTAEIEARDVLQRAREGLLGPLAQAIATAATFGEALAIARSRRVPSATEGRDPLTGRLV